MNDGWKARYTVLCAALLCSAPAAFSGIADYPLRLSVHADGDSKRLVAHNAGAAPVTLHLDDGLPGAEDDEKGRTYIVAPRSELTLGDVSDADGETVRFSFYVGRFDAEPDPAQCYRLPFAEGRAYPITQAYGPGMTSHDNSQNRYAVDFSMPAGVPVLASRSGVVADVTLQYRTGGGEPSLARQANRVTIVHDDGTVAQYAHLAPETPLVMRGQRVEAGTVIGRSGNTGYTGGPHLHMVVRRPAIIDGKVKPVSIPFCFYTGTPPVAFKPAFGMKPVAKYGKPRAAAMPAIRPRRPAN